MAIIEVKDLCKNFGGLRAVKNLSFHLAEGEILGIIGPNGSGKTTVFNLITGIYKPNKGTIRFKGRSIGGLAPYRITGTGISRTFQNIRLFQNMTVLENVQVGMHLRLPSSFSDFFLPRSAGSLSAGGFATKAREYLRFTELADKLGERASNLSYGEQRRLELSRALACDPSLLLLDEPTAGMNPLESTGLMQMIKKIRGRGITILLVEHNMKVLMGVSDRVIVLEAGEKISEGEPQAIQHDPQVIRAYLGTE